jgi:hypothetical protein
MHAIHKNQPASVAALLNAGADVNLESGRTTALIMAAGYGYAGLVKTLLDHGADPRVVAAAGRTALEAAVGGSLDIDRYTSGYCQTATVRALLDHDPELRPGQGSTLARTASRSGCGEIVAMLESR